MWLLPDEFKFVGAFLEITDAIKTCDARILDILIYLGFSYPQENKMINLVLERRWALRQLVAQILSKEEWGKIFKLLNRQRDVDLKDLGYCIVDLANGKTYSITSLK